MPDRATVTCSRARRAIRCVITSEESASGSSRCQTSVGRTSATSGRTMNSRWSVPSAPATARVAGGELPDARERRRRRRDVEERQVCRERVEVRFPRARRVEQQRLRLGGEGQTAIRLTVIDGLDPERIAREEEPPARAVPEREAEHALEVLEAALTLLLVEVQDRLAVAPAPERV